MVFNKSEWSNRNMWRTLIGYPTGAFVILQAVDFFISRYGWSSKLLNVSLVVLICGFPIVLLWTWYHGEAGKQEIRKEEKIIFPILILITIIAAGFTWNKSASVDININSPLSQEVRESKLAVLVFENLTMDAELKPYGKMISDWITRGLMASGEANIINTANIQQQVEDAHLSSGANPQFAEATGIDITIQGRYYIQESDLIINADIVDLRSGKVLYPIKQVEGSIDEKIKLLEDLTQELVGYWVIKEKERFIQNPPKYKAYQELVKGQSLVIENPLMAEKHFRNAFELDTNFLEPLFSLMSVYRNLGMDSIKNELLNFIENKNYNFSKYEKLRYDEMKAIEKRDLVLIGQINEKKLKYDNTDFNALSNSMSAFNQINNPKRALSALNMIDHKILDFADHKISWRRTNQAFAHILLEQYEEVIELANSYPYPLMSVALAVMHMQALIRLDRISEVNKQFDKYIDRGLYDTAGDTTPDYIFISMMCDELLINNHPSMVKDYILKLEALIENKTDSPRYNQIMGNIYFYKGDYNNALTHWEQEIIRFEDYPGWMRVSLIVERLSRLGYCYGKIGKAEKAKETSELLMSQEDNNPSIEANKYYYNARILVSMDKKKEGVEFIEKAVNAGFSFYRPAVFKADPFLMELKDFPPFVELMKPNE